MVTCCPVRPLRTLDSLVEPESQASMLDWGGSRLPHQSNIKPTRLDQNYGKESKIMTLTNPNQPALIKTTSQTHNQTYYCMTFSFVAFTVQVNWLLLIHNMPIPNQMVWDWATVMRWEDQLLVLGYWLREPLLIGSKGILLCPQNMGEPYCVFQAVNAPYAKFKGILQIKGKFYWTISRVMDTVGTRSNHGASGAKTRRLFEINFMWSTWLLSNNNFGVFNSIITSVCCVELKDQVLSDRFPTGILMCHCPEVEYLLIGVATDRVTWEPTPKPIYY